MHTAFVDALPLETNHSISYMSAAASQPRLVTALAPEPQRRNQSRQKEMKANEAKYAEERKQAIAEINKRRPAEQNMYKKRLEQAEASLNTARVRIHVVLCSRANADHDHEGSSL